MAKLMESIGTLVTSAFLKVAPLLSFCKDLLPAWTTGKFSHAGKDSYGMTGWEVDEAVGTLVTSTFERAVGCSPLAFRSWLKS